jgi:tRNA 2-selenouridine synthase
MPERFATLADLLSHRYDDIIDVRSPAEFAEDHVPGAINLPALSNEERARVGTIYTQVAPFDARKIGAALVARNVAEHLETALEGKSGGWRPLLYCWRGGQRSGSFATILKAVGWQAETLDGGYRSYRRLVHAALCDTPLPHRLVLLDGYTGTAKTDLLHRLGAMGVQVLDLEGMAGHRGSILGGDPDGQPSQKGFESAIACRLAVLDPGRPVVLEAESSKVGQRNVPAALWAAMKDAPRIEITAPLGARAKYLVEAYADVIAHRDELMDRLDILRRHRGGAVVDRWLALLEQGAHVDLARALMSDHYDPSYAKSRAAYDARVLATLHSERLAEPDRAALAERIAACLTAEG